MGPGPENSTVLWVSFSGPFPGGMQSGDAGTAVNDDFRVGSGRRFPRNYNSKDPGGTGKGEWCPSPVLPLCSDILGEFWT